MDHFCTKCKQSVKHVVGTGYTYVYNDNFFCKKCSKEVQYKVDARRVRDKSEVLLEDLLTKRRDKIQKLNSEVKRLEEQIQTQTDLLSQLNFLISEHVEGVDK